MAQFPVNAQRLNPYANFKFQVRWGGKWVAGVSKVSTLKRTTEVISHRSGGDPSMSHPAPGRQKFEPITMERGLTQDKEFHDWAGKVWNFGSQLGTEVSLKDFRKDLTIVLYNEAGQPVIAYKVYKAWPSEYQALPDLDANANAVAIEHIKFEHEGWERDTSIVELPEPSLTIVSV
jgi:phage tail-like protein